MSPRTLAVSGALLIALAVPAGAQAAVTIDPLSKPCYVTADTDAGRVGETIVVRAHGFSQNAVVDIAFDGEVRYAGVQVDANGELGVLSPARVDAPFIKRGSRDFTMTITEQGNPANTATVTGRRVALDVRIKPKQAFTTDRIRFRGGGFTLDKPVYAHYVYKGKLRKTVRMARNPNKCGEWTKRAQQIPVADPGKGIWTVQFDQVKKYRLATPEHPSFAVFQQFIVSSAG
jgi:hypothetical protein